MRVQHNIMAMGAYRNYTNNVSAMKKNLERLSSGYRINRAGDDAAGLAISEKMRAQITGLETAQKNAKDGISLVQTAEGALTEVHDMLNRMVELATQSANGTYDNTTDRYQLQKEVNQLMDEINRIADSANFNGIQLLDGSMAIRDAVAASSTSNTELINGMDRIIKTIAGSEDKPYDVAGNMTVLDGKGGTATRAEFKIDLSTMEFTASASDATDAAGTVTITVNGVELKTNGKIDASEGSIQASDIIQSILDNTNNWIDDTKHTVEINGIEWAVDISGDALVFTQQRDPETANEARANFDVEISIEGGDSKFEIKLGDAAANGDAEIGGKYSIKVGTEVTTRGVSLADARKANTVFEIRASDIKDGTKIAIGDLSFVLAVGTDTKVKDTDGDGTSDTGETYVVIDDGDDLNTALNKIYEAIGGNTFNMHYVDKDGKQQDAEFQIGVSDGSHGYPAGLTIQRVNEYEGSDKTGEAGFAFDSLEKLAQNFKMEVTTVTNIEAKDAQKGLTLQIGDTADSFNQLNVNINDCHTDAIGIGGISIADQESAAAAVDAIKAAINYVSDVRGTLGATQNRLDHTINNLSVMTENIQDAESTIRDTDIAEEMMAYTKNNILIQASQAMLAQANQVPQGVLQLLQ